MSEPRIIELPEETDVEEFLDFEIVNEKWSTYEIEDGTILKSKFVLMSAVAYGERDEAGTRLTKFGTNPISVIYSPPELRGPPEPNLSAKELEEYITERNLKFSIIKEGGINEYKFEKATIQVEHTITRIHKTSRYLVDGMPAYVMNGKTSIFATHVTDSSVEVN